MKHDVTGTLCAVAAALGASEIDTDTASAAGQVDVRWNALVASILYETHETGSVPQPDAIEKFVDAADVARVEQALHAGELRHATWRGTTATRDVRLILALASLTDRDHSVLVHVLAVALMYNSPDDVDADIARAHLQQALDAIGG